MFFDPLHPNRPAPIYDIAVAPLGEREADRFTKQGRRGIVLRFGGFYTAHGPSTLETITLLRRRMMPQIGAASNYFSPIYVPGGPCRLSSTWYSGRNLPVVADTPVRFVDYL